MDKIYIPASLPYGVLQPGSSATLPPWLTAGLGPRGYSAVERLHKSGLTAADMWVLDSERRKFSGRQDINFRLLQVHHLACCITPVLAEQSQPNINQACMLLYRQCERGARKGHKYICKTFGRSAGTSKGSRQLMRADGSVQEVAAGGYGVCVQCGMGAK